MPLRRCPAALLKAARRKRADFTEKGFRFHCAEVKPADGSKPVFCVWPAPMASAFVIPLPFFAATAVPAKAGTRPKRLFQPRKWIRAFAGTMRPNSPSQSMLAEAAGQ